MFVLISSVILIFLAGTPNSLEQSCSRPSEQCSTNPEFKYLFFDASSQEGFNLRRDVYMRYAVMLSEMRKRNERLNWNLVLPPFFRLPHWRNEDYYSEPIEWSAFFDIDSLNSYVPVVELNDTFNELPFLDIDRVYVLQNYENAFENGHFAEKWEIVGKCDDLTLRHTWGYSVNTLETLCVKFQGRVSKIWEFISLHPHDKSVMIYHAEIPLHDTYGTKTYWDCRKSMKFNSKLIAIALKYIETNFECNTPKCNTYISVHWRRGDFARSRKYEVPSIKGTAKQIVEALTKHKTKYPKIFVATDADASEVIKLNEALNELGHYAHFYLPEITDLNKYNDGQIAIIEQIICSHAGYFIGTHDSTFTYRIQEDREILGFNSNTTFNRLCPDKGRCEPPSVWKIIH